MHPVLDHIVILVPHQTLQNLPTWITDNFTVLNGGTHADGTTENKLIVFQDGTYLELIAFVEGLDPEKRAQHRWGRRSEGHIVDWAMSMFSDDDDPGAGNQDPEGEFQKVQKRVRDSQHWIGYEDPVVGGRTTPAGKVLEWATSSPVTFKKHQPAFSVGGLPFWCLDRTPRSWRVPHQDPANVNHPSNVVGIAGVTVLFKDGELWHWPEKLTPVYDAIANSNPGSTPVNEWEFQVPVMSGGRGWIVRLEAVLDRRIPDVSVHLKFFTKGEARKISGTFVDGHELEFELVKANE
ncbi:Glyoxalase-like domain containing protein [Rhypophila sp. PSN 637]